MLRLQELHLLTPRLTNINMSLILRAFTHAPRSVLSPLFSRSFSVSQLVQEKGDFIRLRQQDPEAYRQLLDNSIVRKRKHYLANPEKLAKHRENNRLYGIARRGDERMRFYGHLVMWCGRHAWFRQKLPWKSHSPVWHEHSVERYCEGCTWIKSGGRRLWWKQIQSSSPATATATATATEADRWLCTNCYVPKAADWREAMPRGYEDLTTIKEIAKRRDQLGHGA